MQIDSILFDMDGVLVNVKSSYHQAIKETANYFLQKSKKTKRISEYDIVMLKKIPGFNDDWDVTYSLIKHYSISNKNKEISFSPPSEAEKKSSKYENIRQIFQSFYLGSKLYRRFEKSKSPLENEVGFITCERNYLPIDILRKLQKKYPLGIVTGRLRNEALFTLSYLQLKSLFRENFIITCEDTKEQKPSPLPLLLAIKRMNVKNALYIGDTINDEIAAKRANIQYLDINDFNFDVIRSML